MRILWVDDYRDSHPGIIKVRVDVMVDSGDLNHCVAEDVFKRGEDGPKITVGDYTAWKTFWLNWILAWFMISWGVMFYLLWLKLIVKSILYRYGFDVKRNPTLKWDYYGRAHAEVAQARDVRKSGARRPCPPRRLRGSRRWHGLGLSYRTQGR